MTHQNWQDQCNNNTQLIAYLYSTVVRDEFFPRIPDADDIHIAMLQMAANSIDTSHSRASNSEKVLISAPDRIALV